MVPAGIFLLFFSMSAGSNQKEATKKMALLFSGGIIRFRVPESVPEG
jgi:hypothetical protein